jgi:hypothetical protein
MTEHESIARPMDDLSHIFHSRLDSGEFGNRTLNDVSDKPSQRSLSCSGWSPKKESMKTVTMDKLPQRRIGRPNSGLPHQLIGPTGTTLGGERG